MEGLGSIDLEIHGSKIDLDEMIPFFPNLQDREAVKNKGKLKSTGTPLLPFWKEKIYGHQKVPFGYRNLWSQMS
jgi:hypothetical protein